VMFYNYYGSAEFNTINRAFYQNTQGLQDAYVRYVTKVMAAVKGNKYVIGLDPLNEPFPTGPKFEDFVALMDPAIYDNDYLAPLYRAIQSNVTQFEEDNVLFFEPGQMPDEIMDAINFVLGVDLFKDRGFTKPPGGELNSPNHVLNAHTYCCNVWPSMCSDWG